MMQNNFVKPRKRSDEVVVGVQVQEVTAQGVGVVRGAR